MSKSFTVKRDEWLEGFFGSPVWKLIMPDDIFGDPAVHEQSLRHSLQEALTEDCFAYAKVPAADLNKTSLLENIGFRVVDAQVVYRKQMSPRARIAGKCLIREAKDSDRDVVVDMAGRLFKYTRFHIDPLIKTELANSIKAAWVGNFFKGLRGDAMIVAEADGIVVGFLLLIRDSDGNLVVDEIAVEERARGKGAASDMLSAAENMFGESRTFSAGTQIVNIPANACYQRNGFSIAEAHYILHYHYRHGRNNS